MSGFLGGWAWQPDEQPDEILDVVIHGESVSKSLKLFTHHYFPHITISDCVLSQF